MRDRGRSWPHRSLSRDAENPGVFGLLLRLPLAPSRPTCLARGTKEISGIVIRYEDLVADPAPPDATGLRFPRDIV